ncbi:MAG: OmpH family outer membrane protein [Verrucomicrobiaceae bacterium]|nr:MAG: OmpH family outer membrane protein [Verrucomicrobiaceae bacterium]
MMARKTILRSLTALIFTGAAAGLFLLYQNQAESAPAPAPVSAPAAVPSVMAGDGKAPAAAAENKTAPAAGRAASWKIGTVDVGRVFQAYYKTADLERKLNGDRSKAKKDLDSRTGQHRELTTRLTLIEKTLKDRLVSDEMKRQAQNEGRDLMRQANAKAEEIQEFATRRERQLQDQYNRSRKLLVNDILARVEDRAKRDNYDLVFDRSGMGMNGTLAMPFSREAYDFSAEVITELNRQAPAPAPVPDAVAGSKPEAGGAVPGRD